MLNEPPQQIMNFLLVNYLCVRLTRLAGLAFQISYKTECLVSKSTFVGVFYS